MESIEYSILDGTTKEVLHVIGKSHDIRKLYRLDYRNSFAMMPDSVWDGKIKGKPAEGDKTYIYQIKAKLNNKGIGGEGVQIYHYYIKMDNNKPYLSAKAETKLENLGNRWKRVTFKVKDSGIDLKDLYIQSVKCVGGSQNNFDLITPPGTKPVKPSYDLSTPPGTKPTKSVDNSVEDKAGAIKYAKSLHIAFVDGPG